MNLLYANAVQDIGGGWPLHPGEDVALSHVPLVWMVREAQRAGLEFDEGKLQALNCGYPDMLPPQSPSENPRDETVGPVPTIAIENDSATPTPGVTHDRDVSPFGRPASGEYERDASGSQTTSDYQQRSLPHSQYHARFHK